MDIASEAIGGRYPGIKVLVADDQRVNQLILETFLRNEGHTVLVAGDGAQAVAMHAAEHPDLVLMDIQMPVMDGLEAARQINAAGGSRRTPMIFLTAITDQKTMIDGLGLGDDYIPKPIDLAVLRAKLRAFIRLVQSQRLLDQKRQKIATLNDEMNRESEIAAHVLARVLAHTEPPDGKFMQYRVVPSAMFSGDMVLARRTPAGKVHVLLADAVGHGLPAAINILPLFFPFDGMSRKGCSLATVARELNRRVRDLLPQDRFVAATLVSLDPGSCSFEIWNGGNPPALVVDTDGRIRERIDSMQMALGLNEDNPALFEPRRVSCSSAGQLLICSDGIWENRAFAGSDPAIAIEGMLKMTPPMDRLDALIQAAIDAGQGDDLSAVVVTAGDADMRKPVGGRSGQTMAGRLSMQFGPEALVRADVVGPVLDMAESLGLTENFPALKEVLGELFANALDYGVLGLDGTQKHLPDPAGAYAAERKRRMDGLVEGFVIVEIEPTYLDGSRVLRVNVADSGPGFDWRGLPEGGESGLARVRRLASSLDFNSHGSEAIAMLRSRPWPEAGGGHS